MLAKCCNPACAHEFRYLSDGKLFRLENDPALRSSPATREYFWLCPTCSASMMLTLSNEGKVIAVPLSKRIDLDTDFSSRKRWLLLSNVSILRRKNMAEAQHSPSVAGS